VFLTTHSSVSVRSLHDTWKIEPGQISLGEVIGRGAAGSVYRAMWMDMVVAVKTVATPLGEESSGYWDDIQQEIQFLRTIRHPCIVFFFGAGNFRDRESARIVITHVYTSMGVSVHKLAHTNTYTH
jgi:serine/threonine protein kinase